MTDPTTGIDIVRETLRGRNRKLNMAVMARDLGMSADRFVGFAEGRVDFPAETVQQVVKVLWNGHTEYDAETGMLRSANKAPPVSLGVHPPRYEAKPVDYATGIPPMGPQPVVRERRKPKTSRPGWLGGWT